MRLFKITLILILIAVFVTGCSKKEKIEEEKASEDSFLEDESTQKIMTFSISSTADKGKRWSIEGKTADIINPDIIELTDVTGKSYVKDTAITVTAKHGRFDRKKNELRLRKNVVAATEDGLHLMTELLNWDANKEVLWTEDFVKVIKDEILTTGYGLTGQVNLEKIELKRKIEIKVEPSTLITCDGPLEIDYRQNVAYLYTNVKIVDKEGELVADKVKVYFSPDENKITKAIALGNVRIKRDKNETYSMKATYYVDEKKVILTGKPKLIVYSKKDEKF